MAPLPKVDWYGEAVTGGFFSHTHGRAHGPCPTRFCVIGAGRTGSSAPTEMLERLCGAGRCGHRPLRKRNKNCGEAGRRGRRPLRSSIGEWCVGVGLPDDPNRAYTAPLVKPHVIAKPVTEVTGCGNPHSRPLRRGITDSHDQSADGSRNDTQTFLNFPTAFPLFFRLFLLYSRKRRRFA